LKFIVNKQYRNDFEIKLKNNHIDLYKTKIKIQILNKYASPFSRDFWALD